VIDRDITAPLATRHLEAAPLARAGNAIAPVTIAEDMLNDPTMPVLELQ
jgi:hypothetical protein